MTSSVNVMYKQVSERGLPQVPGQVPHNILIVIDISDFLEIFSTVMFEHALNVSCMFFCFTQLSMLRVPCTVPQSALHAFLIRYLNAEE